MSNTYNVENQKKIVVILYLSLTLFLVIVVYFLIFNSIYKYDIENMKYYFIILFTVLSFSLFAQQKRALVVGIADYPTASGWSKINADNDIKLLSKEIKRKGFSQNIIENQKATKNGIIDALKKLQKDARLNDTVLIHFSCHGQQILWVDKDGNKQLKEALIPYDAKLRYKKGEYEGENHLLDLELGDYISKIRKKIGEKGTLFINIDACHSGDAIRAMEDDEPRRGTNAVFTNDPFYTRPNKNAVVKNKVLPNENNLASFCAVYACQSYQNNYELKVENEYYGALTYAFFQMLKSCETSNPRVWAKGIITEMNKRVKKQNPYFESTFTF